MPVDISNIPNQTEKKPAVSLEAVSAATEKAGGYKPIMSIQPGYNSKIAQSMDIIDTYDNYTYYGPEEGFVSRYPNYRPTWTEADWAETQSSGDVRRNAWKQFAGGFQDSFFGSYQNTSDNISAVFSGDFGRLIAQDNAQAAGRSMMAAQDKYPIYASAEMMAEDESKRGLFPSIGKYVPYVGADSGRRWAQLLGQSGFTVGTIGSVVGEEILLGAATAVMPGLAPVTGTRTAANILRLSKAFGNTKKAYQGMRNLARARQTTNAFKQVGKAGLYLGRMTNLASFEAGMEAGMASLTVEQNAVDEFREKNGRLPNAEEMKEIKEAADKAGDFVFGWNLPLLTASNLIVIPNIIKPARPSALLRSGRASKLVARNGKYMARHDAIKEGLQKTLGDRAGSALFTTGKYGYRAGQNVFAEGFEEYAQGIGATAAENYYNPLHKDYGKANRSLLTELGNAISESRETGRGWDEFVAGGIMGLGFSAGGSLLQTARRNVTGEKSELEKTRELANQRNQAMNTFIEDVLHSTNNMNLDHQTQIAVDMREAEGRGDTKRIKDLKTAARASLFQSMYHTGKGEEFVDDMFDLLNVMEEEQAGITEQMLGDSTVGQFKQELMSEYKNYSNDLDTFTTALDLNSLEGKDQQAAMAAAHTLAANNQHMRDGFARIENLRSDITEMVTSTKEGKDANTAFQLEKLFDALIDPTEIDDTIASVETSIQTNEDLLKDTQLPASERKQRKDELSKQKNYLNTLNKVRNTIYNADGSISSNYGADQFVESIVNEVANFAPGVVNEQFANSLKDLMKINSDYEHLVFASNMMRNPEFRKKYVDGFISEAEKSKAQDTLNRVQRGNRFNDVDTRLADTEVLTQEQFDQELSDADLSSNVIDSVLGQLTALKPRVSDGKFVYGGQIYNTREEAQDAIIKNESPEVQQFAAAFKKRANGIQLAEIDPAKMAEAQEREAPAKERISVVEQQQELDRIKGRNTEITPKEADKQIESRREKIESNNKKIDKLKKKEQTPETKAKIKELEEKNAQAKDGIRILEENKPRIERLNDRLEAIKNAKGAVEQLNAIFQFEQDTQQEQIFPTPSQKDEVNKIKDQLALEGYEMSAPQLKTDYTPQMEDEMDAIVEKTDKLPQGIKMIAKVNTPSITKKVEGQGTQVVQSPEVVVVEGTGTDQNLNKLEEELEDIKDRADALGEATPELAQERTNKLQEIQDRKDELKDRYTYEEALPTTVEEAERVKELTEKEKKGIEEGNLSDSAEQKISEKQRRGIPLNETEKKGFDLRNKKALERNRNLGPKTQNQVDKESVTPMTKFSSGILTLNFNLALSGLYAGDNLSKFIERKTSKKVNSLLTKLKGNSGGISIMTISLNDTLIPQEDIIDLSDNDFNPDTVAEELRQRMERDTTENRPGLAVFKDEKNKLYIVANTPQATPKENMPNLQVAVEEKYDLYRTPIVRVIRQGKRMGPIAGSSFQTEEFGVESRRAVAAVNVGNRVQVVMPYNTYNENLIKALDNGDISLQQAMDNVRVDIVSNKQVIGVMRAGDYDAANSEGSQADMKRIQALRNKLNLEQSIKTLKSSRNPITLGSVTVTGKKVHKNLGIDYEVGGLRTSFPSLSAYENALTNDVEIDYFVAIDINEAVNKDGKKIDLAAANRQLEGFRKGGLYVRVQDKNTNEVLTVQAVVEESKGSDVDNAYEAKEEDLQNDSFKNRYYTNLNYTGENPILSTQVFVDEFSTSPLETNKSEEITDDFNESEQGGAVNVETKDNQVISLTNAERDADTKSVTGKDSNDLDVTLNDSDIKAVRIYNNPSQSNRASNAPTTEADTQLNNLFDNLGKVMASTQNRQPKNAEKVLIANNVHKIAELLNNLMDADGIRTDPFSEYLNSEQKVMFDAAIQLLDANNLSMSTTLVRGIVLDKKPAKQFVERTVKTNKLPKGMFVIQEVVSAEVTNAETGKPIRGGKPKYIVAEGTNANVQEYQDAVTSLKEAKSAFRQAEQNSSAAQQEVQEPKKEQTPAAQAAAENTIRDAQDRIRNAEKAVRDAKNKMDLSKPVIITTQDGTVEDSDDVAAYKDNQKAHKDAIARRDKVVAYQNSRIAQAEAALANFETQKEEAPQKQKEQANKALSNAQRNLTRSENKVKDLEGKYASDFVNTLNQEQEDKSRPRPKPNQEPVTQNTEINDSIDAKNKTLEQERETLEQERNKLEAEWAQKTSEVQPETTEQVGEEEVTEEDKELERKRQEILDRQKKELEEIEKNKLIGEEITGPVQVVFDDLEIFLERKGLLEEFKDFLDAYNASPTSRPIQITDNPGVFEAVLKKFGRTDFNESTAVNVVTDAFESEKIDNAIILNRENFNSVDKAGKIQAIAHEIIHNIIANRLDSTQVGFQQSRANFDQGLRDIYADVKNAFAGGLKGERAFNKIGFVGLRSMTSDLNLDTTQPKSNILDNFSAAEINALYITMKAIETSSIEEFATYGLTNPLFSRFLKEIKVERAGTSSQDSLFARLAKLIADFIGVSDTKFNELLNYMTSNKDINVREQIIAGYAEELSALEKPTKKAPKKKSKKAIDSTRVELTDLARKLRANRDALAANSEGLTLEEQEAAKEEVSSTEELENLKTQENVIAEEIDKLNKELKASKKAEKAADKVDPAEVQTEIDNLEVLYRKLTALQSNRDVDLMRRGLRELESQLEDFMTDGQKANKEEGTEAFENTRRNAIKGLQTKISKKQRALQESLDVRPSSEVEADLKNAKEQQDKNLKRQQELQPGVENLNSTPISNEEIAEVDQMISEEAEAKEVTELQKKLDYNPVLDANQEDPYTVFNIPESATTEEVTARYIKLANDVIAEFGDTENTALGLQNLYNSYEKLMDERNAIDDMVDPVRKEQRVIPQGEQLEFQFEETPTEEKKEFVTSNGQEGDTFTMPDGKEVKVTERDDEAGTVTVQKEDETVTISTEDGSRAEAKEEIDYEELREFPPSLSEISEIAAKFRNGIKLSPREIAIKDMYRERFEGVNKFDVGFRSPQEFGLRGAAIALDAVGIDINSDLAELLSTYLDKVEANEEIPGNLNQLMEQAGFEQAKIEAYQDVLTYTSFANIWAYVSQADLITGRENANRLREIALNNTGPIINEINRLQRLDFGQMSAAMIKQTLGVTRRKIEEFFGEQSVYVAGTDVVESLSRDEAIGVMEAMVEFINDMDTNRNVNQVLPNYIKLKNNLGKLGMDLNLSTIGVTTSLSQLQGVGQKLILEDSNNIFGEYLDIEMSDKAKAAFTLAEDTILVKNDKGNMVEVKTENITEELRNSTAVQQDVNFINETLDKMGINADISDVYVAGYHLVNGNATEMIARLTEAKPVVEQILTYREVAGQYQNETVRNFFNKEQQEENVENKTCK